MGTALLVFGVSTAAGASIMAAVWRALVSALAFGAMGWGVTTLVGQAADARGDGKADLEVGALAEQAAAASQPADQAGRSVDLVIPGTSSEELFRPLQPSRLAKRGEER